MSADAWNLRLAHAKLLQGQIKRYRHMANNMRQEDREKEVKNCKMPHIVNEGLSLQLLL